MFQGREKDNCNERYPLTNILPHLPTRGLPKGIKKKTSPEGPSHKLRMRQKGWRNCVGWEGQTLILSVFYVKEYEPTRRTEGLVRQGSEAC